MEFETGLERIIPTQRRSRRLLGVGLELLGQPWTNIEGMPYSQASLCSPLPLADNPFQARDMHGQLVWIAWSFYVGVFCCSRDEGLTNSS